jgi:uncharacterized protein with NAD-binding domain and iron-sulfur cluster/nitrite reductase/ring-hydroxylating ferredoxin subunit
VLRLVPIPSLATAATSETRPAVTIAREFKNPRLELLRLLHDACEIEHALMLQYMYGALSLKPAYNDIAGPPDPARSDCLLGIAVQEMEHFRDVNHMLVQLGGEPNMVRQDFPYESQIYPFEMRLERLSRFSAAKYVYAEAPAGVFQQDQQTESDRQFADAVLAELRPDARMNHVGTLYECVLALFDELEAADARCDFDEMRATIKRIKSEGEVAHFDFFKSLFLGTIGSLQGVADLWGDPSSDRYPSFDAPTNPSALLGHSRVISDPRLLLIGQLGNLHYWIILALLQLSYSASFKIDLTAPAILHMGGALFPLGQLMASERLGMPFDPLSLGYDQNQKAGQLAGWLLQEAKSKAGELARTDPAIAARISAVIDSSVQALAEIFPPKAQPNVAVIGAGPAGLVAACALATRGIPTQLFERASIVGGKVQSYRSDSRSIEHGVHGWWRNYINFDRFLEQVGVNLEFAFQPSDASNLVQSGGIVYRLDKKFNLPSPLDMFVESLRAPYLTLLDTIRFTPFAIHLLAFRHETDYARYDSISFQQLMDDLHVPPRLQRNILTPFILSFDFAVPDRVSAACGMSGMQFYTVHDSKAIFTRWSRVLPADRIFDKIAEYFQRVGGALVLSSPVQSVVIENNQVRGVKYVGTSGAETMSGPPQVVGNIPAAQVPNGDFVSVNTNIGTVWVSQQAGTYAALSARCTHQGCTVNWNAAAHEFQCPCHGGRYDIHGQVLQGPPTQPLATVQTELQGAVVQLIGQAQMAGYQCEDAIIATDTHAAQALLDASPGVGETLKDDVGHLDTTPVMVVRLWFELDTEIPSEIESAITPDAEFIDNFFYLNKFSPTYDVEGRIIEVQSYRVDQWLDRPDSDVLDVVFRDLAGFVPRAQRSKLKASHIQRHTALFTKYAPRNFQLRPGVESGVQGLYLAGDWTRTDWSVWMMERAIVSGLRAASAVLVRRGLPPIDILMLPEEGLLLRVWRWFARILRQLFWSDYPKK